jgi:hypothetical protein
LGPIFRCRCQCIIALGASCRVIHRLGHEWVRTPSSVHRWVARGYVPPGSVVGTLEQRIHVHHAVIERRFAVGRRMSFSIVACVLD